jgi:hypothetical protein
MILTAGSCILEESTNLLAEKEGERERGRQRDGEKAENERDSLLSGPCHD